MFIQRVKHYHQWLRTAIPLKTKSGQIPSDSVRIQGPSKRPSSGHLYPVSCQRTQPSPKVEASHRPKQSQHYSTLRKVQNGNSRVHHDLPDSRGMGIVDRPIERLPSHPHPSKLKEIPKVLLQVPGVPVHLPPFRTSHSPPGLYNDCKGSEANGPLQRTQTSPIPGRLADQVPVSGGSPSEHSRSGRPNPVLGLDNKSGKIRTETTQVFLFVGYEYHLDSALVKPTQERWLKLQDLILRLKSKHVLTARCLMSLIGLLASMEKMVLEGHLHMRPFQFHLKEHWRYPQSLDSLLPWTEAISAHLDWWQNPSNVMRGADQLFTDASNKGWGTHLDQSSTMGLWSDRVKRLHINILELKAVSLALRSFKDQCQNQTVLVATDNSTVVAYINKQGGTHSAEMCALLWKIMTWCHHYHITLKARHIPGCLNVMADLLSRSNQVQSTEWSLHPQVYKQICQKWFTPVTSCRPICHSSEPQSSTVRISCPRPKGLGQRCSEHKLDGSHCLCLPSNGSPSQGDPKNQTMLLPDHRNSPRLARHALVLGPSAALNRDPTTTSSVNNSSQTVPQLCVPQQSRASQPPRLVSRSGQLQEQGFSVEVAERIAAPQRSSRRTIYKSKWALLEKWCRENSVDFSTPSVKHISDFFMYLYQDLNRHPSTIDGYRTAIVDTLGPAGHHIAQSSDLYRLLSSFHRGRPKSSRNLPKWNLSVVLNEVTKAPFEPMKDTDLKHLTLKTAFLLALASGKCCSKIHSWVANKVSNLGQWEKVALFPSSDFIAKNQLAREGSQSVSPVTIPALTTSVDGQFKEDRTLCPVRALRYYLDRTKDLTGTRSLLFISFKKGHTSDIRPATLSSWLKQTILLCYKQADQQALDLVQVKAHDIRAFTASKAFYGGVSDQIMQACHWKAHNTFTNFYLKDLTWSDNNMYLGPVVVAQQVLDPSPQTSYPQKEKRGGGAHPLQPSLQESNPRI